jgi:hypothetical protein
MSKVVKKILLGALFIVVITHRHEDYCRKHEHQIRDGSAKAPFTFGDTRVKSSVTNSKPDEVNFSQMLPLVLSDSISR